MMSGASNLLDEDELEDMIADLDVESINREVFNLFNISYGLDTALALRKLQVLESEDEAFANYIECLKEAHERFLSYIF